MKPPTRLASQALPRLFVSSRPSTLASHPITARALHYSAADPANVAPFCATGPPPEPPQPAPEHPYAKVERRRKQAALLKSAKEIRDASSGKSSGKSPLKKRFWQDVHIKQVDGAHQIYLDSRPLRHPTTKTIVNIPLSKPYLAHALALEWDLLTSAQQATKNHLIPMTSLVCRALDISDDDAKHAGSSLSSGFAPVRTAVADVLLRYLDTDSLLCWAPLPTDPLASDQTPLRELQERTAGEVIGFLTTHGWPGVEIEPVLDEGLLLPRQQKPGVREVIQGWVMGLDAWDLAGLERAALAGKSLLGAARLVVEWSEGSAGRARRDASPGVLPNQSNKKTFGVEEAAKAASLEVDWQTRKWGEVEDTHDVEKEDLRRQLGSTVLLVSGKGAW
ncbi:ATP synthase mitochondrial F1 complex assembly factor 2 [Diaporthe australafricana]|uniref:ATP synthase mitochondrial F1 complex assembly factor 2 n=1 Tax=Diaporthe australafricana TaxID=127596 RepID=A0ABR3VVE7_9PEZI